MKSRTGKSLYNYIPKFAKLIGQTIIVPTEASKKTVLDLSNKVEDDDDDDDDKIDRKKSEEEDYKVEMTPTPTPEDGNLFTDDIVFMFYSKSADKNPGKGNGETIPAEKIIEFNELAKMKNWRKTLSNFYMKPKRDGEVQHLFELDGLKWSSVEHYYHANKFKKNNPEYYRLFSIDSGSHIIDDPKKALGAGGKTGKIAGKKFRPKGKLLWTRTFSTIKIMKELWKRDNKQNMNKMKLLKQCFWLQKRLNCYIMSHLESQKTNVLHLWCFMIL